MLDLDPPEGAGFEHVVRAAHLVREALAGSGLAGAAKTSGSKGVHVVVPVAPGTTVEDAMAATRALAARAERLDPAAATTAFIKDDRHGKVYVDPTRAGGASLACAYSPRARPGRAGVVPAGLGRARRVTPARLHRPTAPGCSATRTRGVSRCRRRRCCRPTLVAEGHAIPVARVAAMHEGKRRARARRTP